MLFVVGKFGLFSDFDDFVIEILSTVQKNLPNFLGCRRKKYKKSLYVNFFLVGNNFSSSTIEYTEDGLIIWWLTCHQNWDYCTTFTHIYINLFLTVNSFTTNTMITHFLGGNVSFSYSEEIYKWLLSSVGESIGLLSQGSWVQAPQQSNFLRKILVWHKSKELLNAPCKVY